MMSNQISELHQELAQVKQRNAQLESKLTEQTQQIKALQTQQNLLQLVIDNIPSLIFWKDRNSVFQGCNRQWAKAAGFSHPAQVIGKTDYDLYPNATNVEVYLEKDRHVINSGESEYQIEYKENKDVWYDTRKIPIRDNQGNIVGILATIEDITRRKKAEEALRIAEQKYRSIFENALEGIFQCDTEGKLLHVNQSMANIYGYENPTDLINNMKKITIQNYVEPKFLEDVEDLHITHEQVKELQYQVYRKDGKPIWIEEQMRIVRDETGKILYYQGIIQDITQRKQSDLIMADYRRSLEAQVLFRTKELEQEIEKRQKREEALEEAKRIADLANQAKSIFLAKMSHELRTPLNAIIGFVQLLQRDDSLSEEHQQKLTIINNSGEHLLTLINSILEISKIEAGQVTINENSFDLSALIRALESMFNLKAQQKNVQLLIENKTAFTHHLRGDESKLRQILTNLLSNAIKFTEKGTVTLRIKQVEQANSEQVSLLFEIEDTGVGIGEHEIDKLFTMFEQTESGQRSQQGTGLGLAISRKFIELMKGEITVRSRIGIGTCFQFSLPVHLSQEEIVTRDDKKAGGKVIGLDANQSCLRILVVEDHEDSRLLMVKLLSTVGFKVKEAKNGKEALEIWSKWQPNLIWMDMQMPVMDGYQATTQIKSTLKGQKTVIIALTASAFEEDKTKVLAVGCDDFVRKPWKEAVIWEKMSEYLGLTYIYAQSSPKNIKPSPSVTTNQDKLSIETALATMSPNWREQLSTMATQLNRKQVLQLIAQIPDDKAHLRENLHNWAQNYRFDLITKLCSSLS